MELQLFWVLHIFFCPPDSLLTRPVSGAPHSGLPIPANERVFCRGRKGTFFDSLRVYGQPTLRVLRISTVGGMPDQPANSRLGFFSGVAC